VRESKPQVAQPDVRARRSRPSRAKALPHLTLLPGRSIREAMSVIDGGGVAIALAVDDDHRLLGTVSDGDLRRALLAGATLEDRVDPYVSRQPTTVREGTGRAEVLDLMRACELNQVPVIDDSGYLVGLHVVQELLGGEKKPNAAVVLAGGRGTRLGSLTAATPKPMLLVAGRPILERIILHLVGSGIQTIYLAVNHLADVIEQFFQDGSTYGVTIRYLRESSAEPRGTGGPLRELIEHGHAPAHPVVVLNGDLVTSFSVRDILEAHSRAGAAMTVALRDYVHDVPFGVVQQDPQDERLISGLSEKPRWSGLVNAGIYVVEPRILEWIPSAVEYPMTDLLGTCLRRGEPVAGWHLLGEWHDIGRPLEFYRARGDL
jgi:dTDP-glucose pyrophosphorylase